MRNILLIFSLIGLNATSLLAQINSSAFPVAGDTVLFTKYYSPTSPQLISNLDQTGSGFTWDFSTWNSAGIDTLYFIQPQGNIFSDSFPSSNLASIFTGHYNTGFFNKLNYYQNSGNIINSLGRAELFNSGSNIPIVADDGQLCFSFPLTIGNSFSDTTIFRVKVVGSDVGLPFDSAMQKSTVYRHDTVDGNGQLITNGFTYTNVIRNKITDVKIDSTYGYTPQQGWQLIEVVQTNNVNIFWHRNDNFLIGWLEAKNDSVSSVYFAKRDYSISLEIVNLPSEGVENIPVPQFEVRAYHLSDHSLATEFNDTISIARADQNFTSYGIVSGRVLAVSGVATFNDVFFTIPENYTLVALSDTTEQSIFQNIIIHPGPDSLVIDDILPTAEGEILNSFNVTLYNSIGQVDNTYSGNISIGKLSGTGKILGTTTRQIINGVVTFNDISFNHSDQYNIVAWLTDLGGIIDSSYVTIINNPNLNWVNIENDTLSEYVDRASFFVWTGGVDGFLSGTSREWYDEVAQHYTFSKRGRIKEVVFYFASWQQVNNSVLNDTYKVKIYDAGVLLQSPAPFSYDYLTDSLPINILGQQSFAASDIQPTDFFVRTPTVVTFDTPVEIYSDFIVALEVNSSTTDDTVVIWTSTIGDGMLENRSMRHTIESANPPMAEGWVRDLDWRPSYNVDNMIMPVIEVDTMDIVTSIKPKITQNVNVYPNPTSGKVIIQATEFIQQIDIFDLAGRLVYSTEFKLIPDTRVILDLENILNGLYTAEISFSNSSSVKEKLVILKP